MPAPEHVAIRVIADHLRNMTTLTTDLHAVKILVLAASELDERASQLEALNTRRRLESPPFNPNPQE